MGFFVYGINHKKCPVEIREKLYLGPEKARESLRLIHAEAPAMEVIILSTCNRTEFYGCAEGDYAKVIAPVLQKITGTEEAFFCSHIETREGKEAVRHIFRVAAGLESLVIGEHEILGQIRDAFRIANEEKTVHSVLYRLMEKALKNGKDVRNTTKINEGAVSIPSVAVELAEKIFGRLASEKVMVIGTGQMSSLTLKTLRDSGAEIRYVVSRDAASGERAASEFAAVWVPLENWESCLSEVDILISSTSSPSPVVLAEQIERAMPARRHRPLFLIDIAVPRDIDPEIHKIDYVYLYNIDDLKKVADANLKLRRKEISQAEEVTETSVLSYVSWLEQLHARPALESFESFLDGVLKQELDRELEGAGLDEKRRGEIRGRIRSKLTHHPIIKIKEASQNGGVARYIEALQALFNLDKDNPREKK